MCDTGNIDANDEKLINEKMALVNTQAKRQENLLVVKEEENLTEESNLAEINLDASVSLMSSSQNSSNNNITLDNSQSTSGGREKRIRKKKKLDEDFVSFDSLPSTSNRAFKKDSQEYQEDEEYFYEDKGTLSQKAEPIYTDSSIVSSEPSAGDLVWAKVCGHPWWPCMITSFPPPININQIELDNDSKDHIKIVGTVKPKKMFCVLFFGPSVEHAWVPDTSIIEYKGVELFKAYAQNQVDLVTPKSVKEKLADRFQLKVASSRREQWEGAVEEADMFLNKSTMERKIYFSQKLMSSNKKSTNKSKIDENKRYRENEKSETVVTSSSNDFVQAKKKKKSMSQNDAEESNQEDENNNQSVKHTIYEPLNTVNSEYYQYGIRDIDDSENDGYENEINNNAISVGEQFTEEKLFNWAENESEIFLKRNHDISFQNGKSQTGLSCQNPTDSMVDIFKCVLSDSNINGNGNENMVVDEDAKKSTVRRKQQRSRIVQNRISSNYLNNVSSNKNIYNLKSSLDFTLHKNSLVVKQEQEDYYEHHDATFDTENEFPNEDNGDDDDDDEGDDDEYENFIPNDTSDDNYSDVEANRVKLIKKKASCIEGNSLSLRCRNNQDTQNHLEFSPLSASENKLVNNESLSFGNSSSSCAVGPLKSSCRKLLPTNSLVNIKNEKINSKMNTIQKNEDSESKSISNQNVAETYLIDRYKYAVRHIRQGLSVEEACNKYRISKGALLKCLSGGTAPRGKKTRLTESEENEIVEWLMDNRDLKYNDAIHLVFEQVENIFHTAQKPNPFSNGKPSMDWWYDFLSRHPQIMASKPEWLRRGKVNDQYIKDVQSGKLRCTKFRRALLSAIQYIRSLGDAALYAAESASNDSSSTSVNQNDSININTFNKITESSKPFDKINESVPIHRQKIKSLLGITNEMDHTGHFIIKNQQNRHDKNVSDVLVPKKSSYQSLQKKEQIQSYELNLNPVRLSDLDDAETYRSSSFNVSSSLDDIFNKTSDEEGDLERLMASYSTGDINARDYEEVNTIHSNSALDENQNLIESMMIDNLSNNLCSISTLINESSNSLQNMINQNNHLLIKDDDDDDDHHHHKENRRFNVRIYDTEKEEADGDDDEDDEDQNEEEDYDEQTHITMLHEFA